MRGKIRQVAISVPSVSGLDLHVGRTRSGAYDFDTLSAGMIVPHAMQYTKQVDTHTP